jgi:predicted metalloenzyme YecM
MQQPLEIYQATSCFNVACFESTSSNQIDVLGLPWPFPGEGRNVDLSKIFADAQKHLWQEERTIAEYFKEQRNEIADALGLEMADVNNVDHVSLLKLMLESAINGGNLILPAISS